ncbi:MAG: hypothetical protein ACK4HE_04205 [Chitinophagaceae bacterium]
MNDTSAISKAQKYDLAIAYRVYPGVSKTPFIYPNDKLKLAEAGIRSLKLSLAKLKAKMYCIMDKCPDTYETMILKYFDVEDVEFIRFNGVGNAKTFGTQIEILLQQTDAEIIFFAEDDYIYRTGCFEAGIHLIKNHKEADFVTLYDHTDSYTLRIHEKHKYRVIVEGGFHWKNAASTCLTFMTTRTVLSKTKHVFYTYCNGNWDSSLWFALTKYNVFSLTKVLYLAFKDVELLKTIILSWLKCGTQILFGKKYRLWQPLPSIATHMEATGIAPNIDWMQVVEEQERIQPMQ